MILFYKKDRWRFLKYPPQIVRMLADQYIFSSNQLSCVTDRLWRCWCIIEQFIWVNCSFLSIAIGHKYYFKSENNSYLKANIEKVHNHISICAIQVIEVGHENKQLLILSISNVGHCKVILFLMRPNDILRI